MPRPAVDLVCDALPAALAKAIAADVGEHGGWPLALAREGLRRRRLHLPDHDGDAHVLDPAARERLAVTVERLGVRLDDFAIAVAADGDSPGEEEVLTATLAARIRADGLPPATRFLVAGTLDDPPREPPDVAGPGAVDAAWARIEARLGAGAPLRGPADPGDLDALAAHVGAALPDPLRRSLLRHDGQEDAIGDAVAPFLADGKWLLPVAQMREDWDMWRRIQADDPDERYRPRHLLTFATDDTGDGLAVDLRDGRIHAYMDTYDPWLVAPRFESWLALWAEQLDQLDA